MPNPRLKRFIQSLEGRSEKVYDDIYGNPTVGVGANLNSPEVPEILENMGMEPEAVRAGEQNLNAEQIEELYNKQLEEKSRAFQDMHQRDFPNAQLSPHQETALKSMYFNSPRLFGPNIKSALDQNRPADVTREILLNSNKDKVPGLMKRRLEEARQYAGPEFQDLVNSLTDEDVAQITNILNNIQNPHERERVYKEYPFLNQLQNRRKFKGLLPY